MAKTAEAVVSVFRLSMGDFDEDKAQDLVERISAASPKPTHIIIDCRDVSMTAQGADYLGKIAEFLQRSGKRMALARVSEDTRYTIQVTKKARSLAMFDTVQQARDAFTPE